MDPESLIARYCVDLEPRENLECPWITSLATLVQQQRVTPISTQILNLRDEIFARRGTYALGVGQFANLWSYYDGFVRKTQSSSRCDKVLYGCVWRGCPASYTLTLLEPQQCVILECFEEHYHSVMDSVQQLPMCTVVRYQVLDVLAKKQYPPASIVVACLETIDKPLRLRVGIERANVAYIEYLMSMLSAKRSGQDLESDSKRRKLGTEFRLRP